MGLTRPSGSAMHTSQIHAVLACWQQWKPGIPGSGLLPVPGLDPTPAHLHWFLVTGPHFILTTIKCPITKACDINSCILFFLLSSHPYLTHDLIQVGCADDRSQVASVRNIWGCRQGAFRHLLVSVCDCRAMVCCYSSPRGS